MKSRIWFPKNPWPAGHAVVKQSWSGRLDAERGLVFDLDLETAQYDAEKKFDDEEEEEDGGWNSPAVWTNYGRCSLSSVKWEKSGFVVGTAKTPFDWRALDGTTFRVDKAKSELPEPSAFGIYLTGHDGVADHSIAFTKTARTWAVSWKAKIALAYIGRTELEHKLKAELQGLTFNGFIVPKTMKPKVAQVLFETLVTDPKAWSLEKRRFVRR